MSVPPSGAQTLKQALKRQALSEGTLPISLLVSWSNTPEVSKQKFYKGNWKGITECLSIISWSPNTTVLIRMS